MILSNRKIVVTTSVVTTSVVTTSDVTTSVATTSDVILRGRVGCRGLGSGG